MTAVVEFTVGHSKVPTWREKIQVSREPVECSDSDEGDYGGYVKPLTDKLTEMLEKCQISPDNESKNKLGSEQAKNICDQLSKVSLQSENNSDSDGITEVLPDKIQPMSDCKCEEVLTECPLALEARGPHGGIPTNYFQNHTSNFGQTHPCMSSIMHGKRRADEDEHLPFKFMQSSNDLNIPPEHKTSNRNFVHTSGGSVSVNLDVEQVVPGVSDIDAILEMLDDNSPKLVQQQGDADLMSDGYTSENSPFQDSVYSPMGLDSPPPSNLSNSSEDSGICSQGMQSPDNRSSEVTSPHQAGINVGSPRSNNSYTQAVVQNQYNYTSKFAVESPMPAHSSDFERYMEDNRDELADVLKIVAQDLIDDKKIKEEQVKQNLCSNNSRNLSKTDDLEKPMSGTKQKVDYNSPTMKDSSCMDKYITCQQQSQQFVKIQPASNITNNLQQPTGTSSVTQSLPLNMTPIVSVPVAVNIVNNTNPKLPVNNKIPVSTGSFLFIAQSQPMVVFSQPPTPSTRKTPKKILPKLTPVLSSSPQGSNSMGLEIKSRVPTTATAAARDNHFVSPKPGNFSNSSLQNNTTSNMANNEDSKKLNLARRLVAKMTSDDLRFQDNEGDTYLLVAACKADKNMVQAILERLEREKLTGMIDVHNIRRQTALYCAVSANNPHMVEMLIRYGADVNTFAERVLQANSCKEVTAAIHVAASSGQEYLETLKALLKSQDLNLNIANSDGQTALHCAILFHNKQNVLSSCKIIDSTQIIETLIHYNADINTQDKKSGKTPLMYALESKNVHLIKSVVKDIKQNKMRTYLRTQSFDGNTAHKILESLKNSLDDNVWQTVHDIIMYSETKSNINGHNIMNNFLY